MIGLRVEREKESMEKAGSNGGWFFQGEEPKRWIWSNRNKNRASKKKAAGKRREGPPAT